MKRFTEYAHAFNYAARLATQTNLGVSIRRVKEFGKTGYNVGFKTNDGSDYLAETVLPGQPLMNCAECSTPEAL